MKHLMFTLLYSVVTSFLIGQNILVVNNSGDAAPEHYETLADAYAAAVDGDILLLHGSVTPYTIGGDMDKQLTFYGPGFNLSSYPDTLTTQVNTATIDPITLVDGAQGSAFFGLTIANVRIDTDNIFFKGCDFTGSANTNTTEIKQNILMEACYVGVRLDFSNSVALTARNTIMQTIANPDPNMPGFILEHCIYTFPGIINSTISNSISFYSSTVNYVNTNVGHTSFAFTAPANCFSCITLKNCNSLFQACNIDRELRYLTLKDASPIMNAALDGTDIGVTGGIEPYKKSGIPSIPYINELTVPFTPDTNTMEVYIKATAEQ